MLPKGYLIGNLTMDPQSGVAQTNSNIYARFSVACNEIYVRPNTQPRAHFFNCVAWGKRAQYIQNFLKKGDKIFMEYSIVTGSYVNAEGRNVKTIDLVVDNIEFIGNRSLTGAPGQRTAADATGPSSDIPPPQEPSLEDDDLTLEQIYSKI